MTDDADVQEQLAELEYRFALGELRMARLQVVGQQLRDLGREVVQVERQLRCLDHALRDVRAQRQALLAATRPVRRRLEDGEGQQGPPAPGSGRAMS
jgi:uncharacterized coiled-coil protein SlyX